MPESFEEINLTENERRRDRLFDRFGNAPVREVHKSPPTADFRQWIEMADAGYIGSAYALVRRSPDDHPPLPDSYTVEDGERVLLVLGRGESQWGIPGGGQEGDETYVSTVQREVKEEVDLEIALGGLSHIEHEISTAEGFEKRLHAYRVFFHADYVRGTIELQPEELHGAAWFADPPTEYLLPETDTLVDAWRKDSAH